MTKEDLLSKANHSLRMKDLREFVENNKDLDGKSPVIIERVEDAYFKECEREGIKIKGWDVLKVGGYHYHNAISWNESMYKEVVRRELGEEPDFNMENPLDHIFGEKYLEEMQEQFYQPHCITTDNEIVYIYSHY